MKSNLKLLFATGVLTLGWVGCVPAPERTPSQVKRLSDIKISIESPSQTAKKSAESAPAAKETPPAEQARIATATTSQEVTSPPASSQTSDYQGPPRFIGRVVVKGTLPELPPLVKEGAPVKDAICAEKEISNQEIVTSPEGGLKNVFVYLRKTPSGDIPPPPTESAELDQLGCVYTPHAQVVRIGQPVTLKNSDPVAHNVRINGFANSFNQTIPANDKTGVEYRFTATENFPVKVQCDFHGWMSALILPLEHPWGAITDENGNFAIENLPEGELEFTLWHEKLGYVNGRKPFSVTAQRDRQVEHVFEVDAAQFNK